MFTLDHVVPWGRSFDEYSRMFAFGGEDLRKTILGCGDGPACFNAEATRRGCHVVSCDPIYRFDTDAIRQRISGTYEQVIEQTRKNAGEFIWDAIASVDELGSIRMDAIRTFLADFEAGSQQGRYVDAELPALPFEDASFDLALCSHLLFLYSEQLGADFHVAAVAELCRVAAEVRIFPLLELGGAPSPHVAPVSACLTEQGWHVTIETVPYEFRRGANQMMRVRRTPAPIDLEPAARTSPRTG